MSDNCRRAGEATVSIVVKNLCFSYDKKTKTLNDVSFEINSAELVGIVGQTGCGKSTLVQILAGLITRDSGEVLIDGEDIFDKKYDRSKLRRSLGIVFQYPETQLFEQTVEKDVAFGLKKFKLSKDEKRDRVKWAIELMGLDFNRVHDKSPLALSGGEKRRVAIAGVLAVKPKYLILDEPLAGLDSFSRDEFMELLVGLKNQGTTVIMISHNSDCLLEYADRIIALSDGSIAFDGNVNTFFSNNALLDEMNIGSCSVKTVVNGLGLPNEIYKYNDLIEAIAGRINE